jgi:hypothetical protein
VLSVLAQILGFVERAAAEGQKVVYVALGTIVTTTAQQVGMIACATYAYYCTVCVCVCVMEGYLPQYRASFRN